MPAAEPPVQNVFKFVAVRPPASEDEREDDDRIDPRESADDLVRRVKAHGEYWRDPGRARESVARSVIAGSYYRDDPEWMRVARVADRLVEAANAASAGEKTREQFAREVADALREAYDNEGLKLEQWIQSEQLGNLERVLWESYVANVLAPWERPADREELVRWLRLLHVVRRAVEGKERFARAIRAFPTARPAIPAGLFEERRAEEEEVAAEVVEEADPRVELNEERERYEVALNALRQLASAKRARGPGRRRAPIVHEGEGTREQATAGGMADEETPWALTETDLDEHREIRAALEEAGLPTAASIPEAVEAIEHALAENVARVAEHSFRRDVLGVGRAMLVLERLGDRPELGRRWPIG